MPRWKEYHTPTTVHDALRLLSRQNGRARLIAGGTDLLLDLETGHTAPVDVLIDVTRIQGIDRIREAAGPEHDWIVLGAGVTHYQIEQSPRLRQVAACLTESCAVVGGPQVRSVATIGGNVAHALPAADGTIGLLALDAQVQVSTLRDGAVEREWLPLLDIFTGPGRNRLTRYQMIEAFRFRPTGRCAASAFDRIMRPQGIALPVLGVAVRVQLDEAGERIEDAAIAVGPAGPIPFRATEAEAILAGDEQFDKTVMEAAIVAAQRQAQIRTSQHRATKEYRHEMIGVLLRRVIHRAVELGRG